MFDGDKASSEALRKFYKLLFWINFGNGLLWIGCSTILSAPMTNMWIFGGALTVLNLWFCNFMMDKVSKELGEEDKEEKDIE